MSMERGRLVGLALVVLGVLAMLGSIPLFRLLPSFIWLVILMLGGAIVWTATSLRLPFWQRLTIYALIGIYATASTGTFAGAAATGFISMAFLLTYMMRPRDWWALI